MEQLLLRRMIQSFSSIGCIVILIFSIIVYQLKIEDTREKLTDMLNQATTAYEEQIEKNETKLEENEEMYLKRAQAIAYFLENDENLLTKKGLRQLQSLMEVQAIHVVDNEGKIGLSSEDKSIGLNLLKHEQAKEFWNLIRSNDKNDYVIQYEAMNIINHEKRSFIGVKTNLKEYSMIQIALEDSVFKNIIHEDIITKVLHRIPTLYEEAIVALNGKTGEVESLTVNNSQEFKIYGKQNGELLSYLKELKNCSIIKINNELHIIQTKTLADGTVLCAIYKMSKLLTNFVFLLLFMSIGLLALLGIYYLILHRILKKYVLDDFQKLEKDVEDIMQGNYDVDFKIQNQTELQSFSIVLNQWKNSYRFKELRMSRIIGALDMHVAIFECLYSINHTFFSKNLITMLGIEDTTLELIKDSCEEFEKFIEKLLETADKNQLIFINGKYVMIRSFKLEQEYYGVVIDKTEEIIANNSIRTELLETKQLINQDSLTSLFNRNGFEEYVEKFIKNHPQEGTLIILDLDNFKKVNDEMGHPEGDRLLQLFANCLQHYFAIDAYWARLGGDEFVVFIKNDLTVHELHTILNNFIIYVRGELHYYYKKFHISTSIGAIIQDEHHYTFDEMYKLADVALYIAKHKGKNTYYINEHHITCMKDKCEQCKDDCERKKVLGI